MNKDLNYAVDCKNTVNNNYTIQELYSQVGFYGIMFAGLKLRQFKEVIEASKKTKRFDRDIDVVIKAQEVDDENNSLSKYAGQAYLKIFFK